LLSLLPLLSPLSLLAPVSMLALVCSGTLLGALLAAPSC
jgi:hypothetical protein